MMSSVWLQCPGGCSLAAVAMEKREERITAVLNSSQIEPEFLKNEFVQAAGGVESSTMNHRCVQTPPFTRWRRRFCLMFFVLPPCLVLLSLSLTFSPQLKDFIQSSGVGAGPALPRALEIVEGNVRWHRLHRRQFYQWLRKPQSP